MELAAGAKKGKKTLTAYAEHSILTQLNFDQAQPQMPGISHEGKERQMPLLRSLSAGMLVLLLVGILAACGGSPPEAQQPTAVPAGHPTAAAPAAEPTAATSAEQPTAA